jgi:hypothetical protein
VLVSYSRLPAYFRLDRIEINNESITIKRDNRSDQISVRRKGFRGGTRIRVGAITWVIEGRNDLTDAEPVVNRQLEMFMKKVAPLMVSKPS